jgi:hypothetical protein
VAMAVHAVAQNDEQHGAEQFCQEWWHRGWSGKRRSYESSGALSMLTGPGGIPSAPRESDRGSSPR